MSWVFGYGSLMWRPGFAYLQRRPATLEGYSRAFCRLSFRHRGTPSAPGMVVGLAPGGACRGIAYHVAAEQEPEMLAYLDEREGAGYLRHKLPIRLDPPPPAGGATAHETAHETVQSWVYLPETGHPSYAPGLPEERIVALIASGQGKSGAAHDYLRELIAELARLGLAEPGLGAILDKVERLRAANGHGERDGTGQENSPA